MNQLHTYSIGCLVMLPIWAMVKSADSPDCWQPIGGIVTKEMQIPAIEAMPQQEDES